MVKGLVKNLAVNHRLTITLIVIAAVSLGILAHFTNDQLETLTNEFITHSSSEERVGEVVEAITKQRNQIYLFTFAIIIIVTLGISWATSKQQSTLIKYAQDLAGKEGNVKNNHLFPELKPLVEKVEKNNSESEQLKLLWKQEEIVFSKLNYGLILADRELKCLIFNTAAENLLDYPRAKAQGRNIMELLEELPGECKAIKDAINKDECIDGLEIRIANRSCENYILFNFDILRDENKVILGYVVVLKDITGLKRHTQIIAEQEKLASIGQMAAGMAHEMRNPLTAIKGFVHLLAEKPSCREEASVYQYLQIVKEEIDRLNSIIGDFLLFARPAKPKLEEVSINELLLETVFLIESQCIMNNIAIEQNLSSQNLIVQGDKNQLKQVLLNLFSNAIDALKDRPVKKIKITSELLSKNSGGNYIRIDIKDTGLGIAQENLERLFTPFFTTKEQGTGLGYVVLSELLKTTGGILKRKAKKE